MAHRNSEAVPKGVRPLGASSQRLGQASGASGPIQLVWSPRSDDGWHAFDYARPKVSGAAKAWHTGSRLLRDGQARWSGHLTLAADGKVASSIRKKRFGPQYRPE